MEPFSTTDAKHQIKKSSTSFSFHTTTAFSPIQQTNRIRILTFPATTRLVMAIMSFQYRNVALAAVLLAACGVDHASAFVAPSISARVASISSAAFVHPLTSTRSFPSNQVGFRVKTGCSSLLRMAADDFNESKYTEAAWSTIATLTKAADYYEASTIEAPILVDILLNPQKHNAGDDAEAAKRVVEKILQSAGANIKDVRSELEKYFAKQPKVGGAAQKMMGRSLQKVLETARETKSVLGVS